MNERVGNRTILACLAAAALGANACEDDGTLPFGHGAQAAVDDETVAGAGAGGVGDVAAAPEAGEANLGGATGESAANAGGMPSEWPCFTPPGYICDPPGFPTVHNTFPLSYECTEGVDCATLIQPEPGLLCLSGPEPVPDAKPRFPLLLHNFVFAPPRLASLSFSIELREPTTAVIVRAARLVSQEPSCVDDPQTCFDYGFELAPITETGPVVATFADFVQQDGASPYQTLGVDTFAGLEVGVYEGAYDFCLRDLKLFDAQGEEILP